MPETKREQQIRERVARISKAAQVSRIDAFEDIPFLLGELDSIDRLLANRDALDDIPDRFGKIAFMLSCLREKGGIELLHKTRARQVEDRKQETPA